MSELPWKRIVYSLESLVLFLVPNLLSSDVDAGLGLLLSSYSCCPACLVNLLLWFYYVSWFGSFHFVPSVCSLRLRTLSHCPRCACNCLLEHLIMVASDLLGKPGVCHPPIGYLFCVFSSWYVETWTFSNCVLRLLCKPSVCTAISWPWFVRIEGVFLLLTSDTV